MGGAQPRVGPRAMSAIGLGVVLVIGMIVGPSVAAGDTTPSQGAVDLSIEVVADIATAGSVVHYESLVRNRGTRVAEQVEGTFEIPAASVAVDMGSPACHAVGLVPLDRNGSDQDQLWTVTCSLGTLPPGAEKRVAFSVTAGPHGTRMSVATVSSALPDARPLDNRLETPLHVLPDGPGFTPAFQQPGRSNPNGRTTA